MKMLSLTMCFVLLINSAGFALAQDKASFGKTELMVPNGDRIDEKSVTVNFFDDRMTIEAKSSAITKTFLYSDIRSAEYSYTKNPRWKTGLGLGAASFVFPPLFLVALPLGFTKHRRHWLTIRTENDFAVLKLSKSTRKLLIPTFETRSGVRVEALGEDK